MSATTVQTETLPNGLTVLTEAMPHVRTVAVGVWVKSGSRVEPAPLNGISHFIEHMVFKGTARRSAEEIAREADALGGHLDAFTAKELVCFNMKVIDENLPPAFDILADLVQGPVFRDADIQKERGVVLEELKMEEDNPDYLVQELFTQNFWSDHALGRPILGTPETLGRLDHAVVSDFFRRWYAPNQMLIAAAGRLEHRRFVALVAEKFGALGPQPDGAGDAPPAPDARVTTRNKKELEQVHLCVGVPCYPLPHERRYAASLLNTILGGGMSSRLFQNIREREGLAYAIFSDVQAYRDTGCLVVYASGRGIAEAARARAGAGSALARAAGGDVQAITAPLVFAAAAQGDAVAAAVVGEACRAVAAIIGTIVNGLNPEVVVITGGVAASLAPLEARIMKAAAEYAFAEALAPAKVSIVPGDKRVTMRGAAALVLYETDRKEESR